MVDSRFFSEQTKHPDALSEIAPATDTGLEQILPNINSKLTEPANLSVTGSDLVLTIGPSIVTTGPSGKQRGLPQIGGVDLGNISGTFNFADGVITGDAVTEVLPTMTAGYYVRAGVEIRTDRKIYVIFGSEGDSPSAAGAPGFSRGSLARGEILLQDDGTGGQGNFVVPTFANISQFGAGSGGGSGGSGLGSINYIENYDAEVSTTGWNTYNDSAAAPVDGEGGTVDAGFTITQDETDPLRGEGSFLITAPALNIQGHGVSVDLQTIDNLDKDSLIEFSLDFESGGNYAGDLEFYVYDVDGAAIITPLGNNVLPEGKGRFYGQFYSTANKNYRLIIHAATTNATGWTYKYDLTVLGPKLPQESITEVIHVASHLFTPGQFVYHDKGSWGLAKADQLSTCEKIGLVVDAIDSQNFRVLWRGRFRLSGPNRPTGQYYLSDTVAGGINQETDNLYHVPVAYFDAATTGWFDPIYPRKVESDPILSFALRRVVGSLLYIRGGYRPLSNGEELATGDGTLSSEVGVNISINLTTILGSTPADDTTYYLYVDREKLPDPITVDDLGKEVIQVYDNSHFALLTTKPKLINPFRYVYLGTVHSADTGNSWTGTGSAITTLPPKLTELVNDSFAMAESNTIEITSSAFDVEYPHGLSGRPQIVSCWYDNGSEEIVQDFNNFVSKRDDSVVRASTGGLTLTGTQKLIIEVIYLPGRGNRALINQNQFDSGWMSDNSLTSIPFGEGVTDAEDIKGFSLIEWDKTTNRRYIRLVDELVTYWDDNNVYLNWYSFTPSANLQYRLVAGGNPLPQALLLEQGGFTKLVGFGPGSYNSISAAVAALVSGDSLLVAKSETFTAPLTIPTSDVRIKFQPGVRLTFTGGAKGIEVAGDRVTLEDPHVVGQLNGTLSSAIELAGTDCEVPAAKVESNDASMTITNAIEMTAPSVRCFVGRLSLIKTAGAISGGVNDLGTDNDYLSVRG